MKTTIAIPLYQNAYKIYVALQKTLNISLIELQNCLALICFWDNSVGNELSWGQSVQHWSCDDKMSRFESIQFSKLVWG